MLQQHPPRLSKKRTPAGYFFLRLVVKFSKPVLSFDEQIDLLEQRGMHIPDRDEALSALSRLNYYRLSAYWYPFYDGDPKHHQFRPGTSFHTVLRLYDFDRRLRLRITDAVERFEVALRTQFAYQLAHRHGPWAYEEPRHFAEQQAHTGRLASLDRELTRSEETFIKHYRNTYSDPQRPPIWITAEVMSLGLLSGLYKNLAARSDRKAIADVFGLDETVLASFAHHVTVVRNICAHHGRLWNRQLVVTMQLPRRGDADLLTSLNTSAPRKLYNTLAILCWLLRSISDDTRWCGQIMGLISDYPEVNPLEMGFPARWDKLPLWVL